MRALPWAFAALLAMCAPAQAAWTQYLSHSLGFAVDFPVVPKAAKGSYKGAVAGTRQTVMYTATDNNIAYTITVIDFKDRATEGSTLMEEAAYIVQENKSVRMMDFARVQTGKDAIYGRRMTIDMPKNGGRKSAALFFTKGKLYWLEATVLPANGDFGAPEAGRFVDSLNFDLKDVAPGSPELPPPPK